DGPSGIVYILQGAGRERGKIRTRVGNYVLDHRGDLPAHQLMTSADRIERWIALPDLRKYAAGKRDVLQHVEGQKTGTQAIIDVVGIVGDIVGYRRCLSFNRREFSK